MPIYKRCSRCGRRIPTGATCPCVRERNAARHRDYDRNRRDSRSKKFYNSDEWKRTKEQVLNLDGMDVYVFMTTGRVMAADTVHHIVPLRDDWSKRCDKNNLMSLHSTTHSMIEQEYRKNKMMMEKKLSKMLSDFRKLQTQGG